MKKVYFFLLMAALICACSSKSNVKNIQPEKIDIQKTTTATENNSSELTNISDKKDMKEKIVVVIDPGHGGNFKGIGGVSFTERKKIGDKTVYMAKNKKQYSDAAICKKNNGNKDCSKKTVPIYKNVKTIKEQDINLSLSLALKKVLDKDSRLKVIMTRDSDIALGKDLISNFRKRNEIASENNADIFISMHTDAPPSTKYLYESCDMHRGFSIFHRSTDKDGGKLDTLRGETEEEKQHDAALQENAKIQGIILAEKVSEELLKKGFTQYKKPAYDISTGKTDYILRTSRWPAILIETGFICNDNDRKILTDIEGNTKIAEGIYNGIKEYIKQSTLSSK